jgi:hypothetical protein
MVFHKALFLDQCCFCYVLMSANNVQSKNKEMIKTFIEWCERNRLVINKVKTIAISFNQPQEVQFEWPSIKIYDTVIKYSEQLKFLGCVSTCATTQLEACQYTRRRSNGQMETAPAVGKRQIHTRISRSESGRHALPCVDPLRTHFAHASPPAYCCSYACNQRMCHIACVVAQAETQP